MAVYCTDSLEWPRHLEHIHTVDPDWKEGHWTEDGWVADEPVPDGFMVIDENLPDNTLIWADGADPETDPPIKVLISYEKPVLQTETVDGVVTRAYFEWTFVEEDYVSIGPDDPIPE